MSQPEGKVAVARIASGNGAIATYNLSKELPCPHPGGSDAEIGADARTPAGTIKKCKAAAAEKQDTAGGRAPTTPKAMQKAPYDAYTLVPTSDPPFIGANTELDSDASCGVLDTYDAVVKHLYAAGAGLTWYRSLTVDTSTAVPSSDRLSQERRLRARLRRRRR